MEREGKGMGVGKGKKDRTEKEGTYSWVLHLVSLGMRIDTYVLETYKFPTANISEDGYVDGERGAKCKGYIQQFCYVGKGIAAPR